MLAINKETQTIIRSGALSATFFLLLPVFPPLWMLITWFSMAPICYVGFIFGMRSMLLSFLMPLFVITIVTNPIYALIMLIVYFLPQWAMMLCFYTKKNNRFRFQLGDILSLLTFSVFTFIALLTPNFVENITSPNLEPQILQYLNQIKTQFPLGLEFAPGISSCLWIAMLWFNFVIGLNAALRLGKLRRKLDVFPKKTPHYVSWDIPFLTGVWLFLLEQVYYPSLTLRAIAILLTFSASFPLFMRGYEIMQMYAILKKWSPFLLMGLNLLIFILVWPMFFVVLLALIDPVYGIRDNLIVAFKGMEK